MKLYYIFLLVLGLAVEVQAFQLEVQNAAGAPVLVGDGYRELAALAGKTTWDVSGGSLWFTLPNTNIPPVLVPVDGFDFTLLDQLRVTVGTTNVYVEGQAFSNTRWLWSGFTLSTTVFGFAWIIRIVRGITNHGGEL